MVLPWFDADLEKFNDRWQRRGELMAGIGATAAFTWLAAALPSLSTTHTDIWPPLAVAVAVAAGGLYAVIAADTDRGWLPGRGELHQTAEGRSVGEFVSETVSGIQANAPQRALVNSLNRLASELERMNDSAPDDSR
jgi:hypothetical protein